MKKILSFVMSISLLIIITTGCGERNRQVVPYESDSEDVYVPLMPNEEEQPDGYTYGPDSIPGLSMDYDMTTDNQEIYVHIETFTILDINPRVTASLLTFVKNELEESGFIKVNKVFSSKEEYELTNDSIFSRNYIFREFDNLKEEFYKELPIIEEYGSAFNIVFNIYPVYIDRKYVTYRESAYCYTGGAHGNVSTKLVTYDLESGKALNLYDIVKSERINEVREEVAAHMAYSYPIYDNIHTVNQYLDSLNVWLGTDNTEESGGEARITLENFPLPAPALNATGLVFIYETYQLTPGSDGSPVVVLPYAELKGCLKVNP